MKKRQSKKQNTLQLSPLKKRTFTLIVLTIPFVVVVLFETGLRLVNYGGDTTLFVSTPNENSPYLGLNKNAGRRFFYRDTTFLPSPRKDLFLKKKPENGYRIFVLGGSTAAGFPYGNNLTFSRILHRRLVHTFPKKHIEVVNCAFTAINTYTLLDYTDEILAQQPDLLLVYAGHNEYYGALGVSSMESLGRQRWFVKSYLQLQRFKLFLWLRNSINAVRSALFSERKKETWDPTRTVMSRIVKDKTIPYRSSVYKKGLKQFQSNMQDIVDKAEKAGVPVILSELVSNIRDHEPFVSVETENYPAAINEYKKAQQAEQYQNFQQAKKLYYNAKDYDALRFRASEDFNAMLHELASENNIPIVPMKNYFEQASPHELFGENLIWEHLHPKSHGYFLMADAFFETIREHDYVVSDWSQVDYMPGRYYEQNWGLTKLDSVHAELSIQQLKESWPFVPGGTPNRFMTRFEPESIEEQIVYNILSRGESTLEQGHIQLASMYEKNEQYVKALREYKALIYTVPTLDVFYQPMIRLLLQMQEYRLALQILHEALWYQDTAFVYKWIGQIYLILNETERGIQFLKEALERDPEDAQSMYNLTRAYYNQGRINAGDHYLKQLRTMIEDTKEFQDLLKFRQTLLTEKQSNQN